MKIKRGTLNRIVVEEFVRHLKELAEAGDKGDEPKADEEPPVKATKTTVQKGQDPQGKKAPPAPKGKDKDAPKAPKKSPELPPSEEDPAMEPEVPDGEDPADDELDDEMPDDSGEDSSGGIGDELVGKTVQALTIEPKSKLLPGAKEIVISFKETTDPLKILLTSTGTVKFFYRGKLSDMP